MQRSLINHRTGQDRFAIIFMSKDEAFECAGGSWSEVALDANFVTFHVDHIAIANTSKTQNKGGRQDCNHTKV